VALGMEGPGEWLPHAPPNAQLTTCFTPVGSLFGSRVTLLKALSISITEKKFKRSVVQHGDCG
jgi:hypothetical protein